MTFSLSTGRYWADSKPNLPVHFLEQLLAPDVRMGFNGHNIDIWGFPCGSDGKESTCRQPKLYPWSERSPGKGNGNPLQYSCLGYPESRGEGQDKLATRGPQSMGSKSQTWLSDWAHMPLNSKWEAAGEGGEPSAQMQVWTLWRKKGKKKLDSIITVYFQESSSWADDDPQPQVCISQEWLAPSTQACLAVGGWGMRMGKVSVQRSSVNYTTYSGGSETPIAPLPHLFPGHCI